MNRPESHFLESGPGQGVVCLHSNGSSGAQWTRLIAGLPPHFHAFAPDLSGAGASPRWWSDRALTLSDEVDLIEPVMAKAGAPFFLVGHSYGAAVALIAALRDPRRVRALALYEPTLFSLVDAENARPNDADGIRHVVTDALESLVARNEFDAAERFVDYWSGQGYWAKMPEHRQKTLAATMVDVGGWGHALFTEPATLDAFRSLDIPVLYMLGELSPPSALAVARILTKSLPRVEVVEFEGLGHMGPISDPTRVNGAILDFLHRHHVGSDAAPRGKSSLLNINKAVSIRT